MSPAWGSIVVGATYWRQERDKEAGLTRFTFTDAQGREVLRVSVPDWQPGFPVIHNNGDELFRAVERKVGG